MRKKRMKKWISVFLTAAVLCSLTACGPINSLSDTSVGREDGNQQDDLERDIQTYLEPEPADEPDTRTGQRSGPDRVTGMDGWKQFFEKTFYQTVSDAAMGNRIYSPVNLYLCLAMLSETSDGNTRKQITALLGQDDQEKIRSQSETLYQRVYRSPVDVKCREESGEQKSSGAYENQCVLGNSLWFNEQIPYQKKVINCLEKYYFADSFSGKMGTTAMDEDIQHWVDNMTGGKLNEQQIRGIRTKPETAMMMLSSINFEAGWQTPFQKRKTKKGTFHDMAYYTCETMSEEEKTEKTKCDFLHGNLITNVEKAEDYTALVLPMQNEVRMHIVLPDEGVTVQDIMERDKGKDIVRSCLGDSETAENACVELSLPKFHIDNSFELNQVLTDLGVSDLFDSSKADFSPLVQGEKGSDEDIYVSTAQQSGSMTVDESGCSVASYTSFGLESGSMPPDKKYKINCNRPFLFMIVDGNNIPLFTGVIHTLGD